jgi:hypothetical protein
MAYGLHITSTSGDLLVSSDIKSYHYVGSPTYTGVQSSYDNYSGSRVYRYTFTDSQTPLIFIKPADVNKFYAVLTHFKSGNNWTYDVIGSGTSNQPPTLYAFSALSGSNSSGGYGLLVQDGSGNRTFDSRDKPLAIVDIVSAIPPDVAADGGITSTGNVDPGWHDCDVNNGYRPGMEHNFSSNNSHNDYSYSNSGHNSNYMFAAPSIAQAAYRKNAYHYHCDGCSNWIQADQHHTFTGNLGVFYRQAYKLTSSQVQAGWCSVKEFWWGKAEKTSWAPWNSECDGSGSFGIPFSQKSINRVSNSVIIADATNYV